MKTKTIIPSEHNEQVMLINWFKMQYKQYIIFAIPNGGNRNVFEAKKLKDEGVLAGIPDLQIIADNKVIFVEMKTRKGKLSKVQKDLIPKIRKLGIDVIIGYGFEDAKNKILEVLSEHNN